MAETAQTTCRNERLSRLGILEEPMGYVDGMSLYEYVSSRPVTAVDPFGLAAATTQATTQSIVETLIRQLSSDDPDERNNALFELENLLLTNSTILSLLLPFGVTDDPERRQSVNDLTDGISVTVMGAQLTESVVTLKKGKQYHVRIARVARGKLKDFFTLATLQKAGPIGDSFPPPLSADQAPGDNVYIETDDRNVLELVGGQPEKADGVGFVGPIGVLGRVLIPTGKQFGRVELPSMFFDEIRSPYAYATFEAKNCGYAKITVLFRQAFDPSQRQEAMRAVLVRVVE